MKNKLKEMLLKHKPITEQTTDIDDIWEETVADGAEDFEEIPEDGTPQEAPIEDEAVVDVPEEEEEDTEDEENDEDVPEEEEEDGHTIADAIEESFIIPKSLKIKYHNSRIKTNTKKVNKDLDKLEDETDADKIKKLKAKVDKNATKIDSHTDKYKETHDKKHEKLAEKILYKPGHLEKMIRDPRKLKKITNPSMFAAQVENRSQTDSLLSGNLTKSATKQRDDAARHTEELKQAGKVPEHKEEPKVMPTTKIASTTVQTPHQKVASNAEAVKERLSKVRASM